MLFVRKNPTPQQLALITAINIAVFFAIFLLVVKLLAPPTYPWWIVAAAPLLVFGISYYAVSEALVRFIYRKIKLIYKTIHRFKAPKTEQGSGINLRNHIIDEVEREVREWAIDRKQEIDDLKKMEAYRRDFFGNVSHELKTPIFNIQGYIYTLLDGGLEDENINLKYLQKAAENIERLDNIVQDLTTIAQLEAGAINLDMVVFNIYDLCREVIDDLSLHAAERDVKLQFKEGSRKAFMVKADTETIRQVLTNLVVNSIKYGREGGNTYIGFYDMEHSILVEISDDGPGIAKEHLPRLFERFYRVDKGRARDQGGTGLGLAIVKHIIEAHNQTINVRSTQGIGSTFGFTLDKA